MMTKKQAKHWAEHPSKIPENMKDLLKKTPEQIKNDITHAVIFDYGNTTKTCADRLVMMGIFDLNYNLTILGQEYVKRFA